MPPSRYSLSRLLHRRLSQAAHPELFFLQARWITREHEIGRAQWSPSQGCLLARSRPFSNSRRRYEATHAKEPAKEASEEKRNEGRSRSNTAAWRGALGFAAWIPLAAFVVSHVVSLGQIRGGSMIPTFNPEALTPGTKHKCDIVLLNRWVIGKNFYRVGDIVTLTSPENPDLLLTKRILALEGDIVVLHVPNNPMTSLLEDFGVDARTRIRVPAGHAWVEGDASAEEDAHLGVGKGKGRSVGHSDDSREFGPVPLGLITSRVDFILWPPSRMGRAGPRPGFDASQGDFVSFDGTRNVNRHHDHRRSAGRHRPHPDDSPLTPFLDDAEFEMEKTGKIVRSGSSNASAVSPERMSTLEEAKRREDMEDQKSLGVSRVGQGSDDEEEAMARRREWLNSLSRGGMLGRDAVDEESLPPPRKSRLL